MPRITLSHTQEQQSKLYTIQAIRALAALIVVFYHATQLCSSYFGSTPFGGFFLFGFCGVHIFFTLSGFIIFTAHYKDIGRPARLGRYVKNRFIRIYPIYWMTLVGAIFIYSDLSLAAPLVLLKETWHNTTLFRLPLDPINPVCWTLSFEVLFYLIFSTLIINKRFGMLIFFCWGTAIIASNFSFVSFHLPVDFRYIFHINTVLFFAGMVSSYFVMFCDLSRRICSGWTLVFTIFVAAVTFTSTVMYSFDEGGNETYIILSLSFSCALILTTSTSDVCNKFFKERTYLIRIGDASYSIYLIHYFFLQKIIDFLSVNIRLHDTLPVTLLFIGLCSITVLTGYCTYTFIERPIIVLLRNQSQVLHRLVKLSG